MDGSGRPSKTARKTTLTAVVALVVVIALLVVGFVVARFTKGPDTGPDAPAPGGAQAPVVAPTATQPPDRRNPAGGVGRIALSSDGNQHDEDDWAGAAMGLAILAHRNLQPDVVHYDYNNHVWDSDPRHHRNMTESVLGAGERFGFDTSRFYDATVPDQLADGVENLTAEINASGQDDELWLVLAGPMETAWMALDAADPEARKSVKCLSHGEWNELHGQTDHGGHSYEDLIDLGCQQVQIPDQNSNLGETDMSDWDYLKNGEEKMEWLYSRIELLGNGDVSDAGMNLFVITGDKNVTRDELRSFFGR